jgi:membrane fusion protein, multidrug efflux system
LQSGKSGVIVNYTTNKVMINPMKTRFVLPFIGLIAAAAAISGCGTSAQSEPVAEKAKVEASPVEVAIVGSGDIDARYAGTAALEADREAKISTEVSGVILDLLVEEGAHVHKGQVLARMDSDKSRLQVRQAEGEVERLKNDVARNERLMTRQLIGRQVAEQSQFDYATRKAEVDLAKVSLRKSDIVAPFDGVVTRRLVKLGQLLNVHDVAFEMADFRDLRAQLRVPERAAVAIHGTQTVNFTADAFPGEDFTAHVERVAPVVDAASGTTTVTVAISNVDGRLRPGLFTRMSVVFDHVDNAALLPKAAIQTSLGLSSVFVVENGKVRRQQVTLGHEAGNNIQVLSGVGPGDAVVVAGQSGLQDGAQVEVLTLDTERTALVAAATKRG